MIAAALCVFLAAPNYKVETLQGWTLHIRTELVESQPTQLKEAKALLGLQLKEIRDRLPAEAVARLQKVQLWFSPEYPGIGPRAEYHPGRDWLVSNGRDPSMVKGVEFTNIRVFEPETRRMPNFALHELAHAYHDQVLSDGFRNREVANAFLEAKGAGLYAKVTRRDAGGKETQEPSYALTNPMEFFAELTESFFSQNDFAPFDRIQLGIHDPGSTQVVRKAWGVPEIERPPASMKLGDFYGKYFDAGGYPVLASSRVNDYALKEAGYLIDLLLAKRHDIKAAMVRGGSRMVVIGYNQWTTDVPEYQWLKPKDFWDARARGLGGSETDPVCSCAEENVLGYPGDPYVKESIVIHEFAHSIHIRGVRKVDPTFQKRLDDTFAEAMKKGLWKGKYASTNSAEYFAEAVQSWFDNNRENDHDHNHVDTRKELIEYDPDLAALCREVFGETQLKYSKPATRLTGHLAGYDPSKAPTFVWPDRLNKARGDIKRDAEKRSNGGG